MTENIKCPLFKVYKEFQCLLSDCKYWHENKCNFDEDRKRKYQKLASARLERAYIKDGDGLNQLQQQSIWDRHKK